MLTGQNINRGYWISTTPVKCTNLLINDEDLSSSLSPTESLAFSGRCYLLFESTRFSLKKFDEAYEKGVDLLNSNLDAMFEHLFA
jgi:hypothetical protein